MWMKVTRRSRSLLFHHSYEAKQKLVQPFKYVHDLINDLFNVSTIQYIVWKIFQFFVYTKDYPGNVLATIYSK
jgi:hypothetical protein